MKLFAFFGQPTLSICSAKRFFFGCWYVTSLDHEISCHQTYWKSRNHEIWNAWNAQIFSVGDPLPRPYLWQLWSLDLHAYGAQAEQDIPPPWKNPSTQFMHLSANCTQLFMKPVSLNIYWRVVCNYGTGHLSVCCARSHQSSSLLLMSQPTSLTLNHSSWSLLIKAVSLSLCLTFSWPTLDRASTLFIENLLSNIVWSVFTATDCSVSCIILLWLSCVVCYSYN